MDYFKHIQQKYHDKQEQMKTQKNVAEHQAVNKQELVSGLVVSSADGFNG